MRTGTSGGGCMGPSNAIMQNDFEGGHREHPSICNHTALTPLSPQTKTAHAQARATHLMNNMTSCTTQWAREACNRFISKASYNKSPASGGSAVQPPSLLEGGSTAVSGGAILPKYAPITERYAHCNSQLFGRLDACEPSCDTGYEADTEKE
jgi:hypothetical protein